MTNSKVLIVFGIFATFFIVTECNDIESTIDFLSKYGYLPIPRANKTTRIIQANDFSKAVIKFQKFVGIAPTGVVDDDTRIQMQRPRCGLADPSSSTRSQKYVLAGKWEKRHLTYRVVKYTKKMDKSEVDQELAKAFDLWANHAKITFQPVNTKSDIEIRFSKYGLPFNRFDGPLGTLAYAFYPQNGDIYFDDSEDWMGGKGLGMSLFYVAVHEIGHSLGLAHSSSRNAIMYPYLRTGYDDLNYDDIYGIQRLYGARSEPHRPTTSYPTPPRRRYLPFYPFYYSYPSYSVYKKTRYYG